MPIHHAPPPPDLDRVVAAGVARVLAGASGARFGLPQRPDAIQVVEPQPVYALDPHDLEAGSGLSRARRTGWRVVVFVADAPFGVATLAGGEAGRPLRFAGLAGRAHAGALLQAVFRAELSPDALLEEFELRLLVVPSARMSAVWLHGKRDLLLPLHALPAAGLAAQDPIEASVALAALATYLRDRARRRLRDPG